MTDAEVVDVIKTNLGGVYTIQPGVGKTISSAKHKQEAEEVFIFFKRVTKPIHNVIIFVCS